VKFLSPYSPDLFPIELYCSKIQVILRYEAAWTSNVLEEAITKAINAITDENALNGLYDCGLFLEPIRLLILW
jgi:transposase